MVSTETVRWGFTSSEERRRGLLHQRKPGGEISYCVSFFPSRSRFVPIWVWLNLGVFEYNKPGLGGSQVQFERRKAGRWTAEDQQEDHIFCGGLAAGTTTSLKHVIKWAVRARWLEPATQDNLQTLCFCQGLRRHGRRNFTTVAETWHTVGNTSTVAETCHAG